MRLVEYLFGRASTTLLMITIILIQITSICWHYSIIICLGKLCPLVTHLKIKILANVYDSILFCRDFAIDHALEINLSKMPNEIPSNIDRSGPWISSALMHLLKLTLSALHFDVNVDENIANGTSSSTTILFPLPKWPLSSSSLNMTKRHSTVGSERAKIIYKASIECSSAIEGSLGPSNNCNQQSPAPITSSQASTVNENPYFATHLSFKYIKMNREDAINLWTQSCRMTAHLVDLKSNYAVSRRALFCLKVSLCASVMLLRTHSRVLVLYSDGFKDICCEL